MKKINLPIAEDEISPMNPDWNRLGKMLWIIIMIIISSYFILHVTVQLFIVSLSIQEEKELFSHFVEQEKIFDIEQLENKFSSDYDIYILDEDYEANAYAIPGAVVYLTQALLDEIQYEEELIFILWHEFAHIQDRDVLKMYARDIPFRFILASVWFDTALTGISLSNITWNYISQATEKSADKWWIELVNSLGLNLECATWFFERNSWDLSQFSSMFSSHPSDISRIENIKNNAKYKTECTKFEIKNTES